MKRRELFEKVATVAAGAGLVRVSTATAVQTSTSAKPALAVFECQGNISLAQAENIKASWDYVAAKGSPFEGVIALVLSDGIKLTLLDANGHVLNRELKDEGV
jgi:hypothetical protein